jgi:hypothetical protein
LDLTDTYRNQEALSPAQVLGNKSTEQGRRVRSVGEEEREDSHVKATLMHEVQVANRRCADGGWRTCPNPVKCPGDHDARPRVAVSRADIGHGREQVAQEVDRPSPINVCQWHREQRAYAGEDNVHRKFVGGLHDGNVELLAEWHERWIDDCTCHGSEEGKKRDLEKHEQLEGWRPVLAFVSKWY